MPPHRAPVSTDALSSPECYAQKVVNYSKLDAHAEYYSGIHYSRLGNLLISPYKCYGEEWAISIPQNEFHSVTLCDLTKTQDDPARSVFFSRPEDFSQFLNSQVLRSRDEPNNNGEDSTNLDHFSASTIAPQRRPTTASQSSSQSQTGSKHLERLVFLRGFPSAPTLNYLGATLDVDPEFFYRHLDQPSNLTPNVPRLDYSYSTPFPESRDLIQMQVCNTGSWDLNGSNPALAALRKSCEDSLRDQLEDFARLRSFSVRD